MKRTQWILASFLGLALALPAAAQAPGSAIGAALRAGTLGGGIEAATPLLPRLNLRAGIQGGEASLDEQEYGGNEYDLDLSLQALSLLADYHLMGGGFRLTGGVMLNSNGLDVVGRPGEGTSVTFEIGGQVYDAASEVQALTGELEFGSMAPYAGIGWGNMVGEDKRFGFLLDLGVLFQGTPTVSLSTIDTLDDTTPVPGDGRTAKQILRDNVAAEEADLEDDISDYDLYPVLSIGISYRFL